MLSRNVRSLFSRFAVGRHYSSTVGIAENSVNLLSEREIRMFDEQTHLFKRRLLYDLNGDTPSKWTAEDFINVGAVRNLRVINNLNDQFDAIFDTDGSFTNFCENINPTLRDLCISYAKICENMQQSMDKSGRRYERVFESLVPWLFAAAQLTPSNGFISFGAPEYVKVIVFLMELSLYCTYIGKGHWYFQNYLF